jgi:hypothetical protein
MAAMKGNRYRPWGLYDFGTTRYCAIIANNVKMMPAVKIIVAKVLCGVCSPPLERMKRITPMQAPTMRPAVTHLKAWTTLAGMWILIQPN